MLAFILPWHLSDNFLLAGKNCDNKAPRLRAGLFVSFAKQGVTMACATLLFAAFGCDLVPFDQNQSAVSFEASQTATSSWALMTSFSFGPQGELALPLAVA